MPCSTPSEEAGRLQIPPVVNVQGSVVSLGPKAWGNPGPIGLFAFGMTTLMLMYVDTTWASSSFKHLVFGYAMIYGGATQTIAGILELIKGNTFAATAFMSYGAFWIGWWFLNLFQRLGHFDSASEFETGECLWFIQWGLFTTAFFLITLFKKPIALRVVFGSLALTFFLLAGGIYDSDVKKAGGYIGFFCGLSACYAAFGEVVKAEMPEFFWPGL